MRLTPQGHKQAQEAGRKLRDLLNPDDTLHFFTSPYRRTRETTEGILSSLTSDDPTPSPFPRHTITVHEEPRLREQDFGNFQPCSAEMERMWQERADYGHFFYRIPNGESAADAYDRVSGFNDSLWRRFDEKEFASVCILVTHGLMTRIFLMKWYHFSVEYFEDLRNINHCEFVVMKQNHDRQKYILQNQLRTWSQLRKERELKGVADVLPLNPGRGDGAIPIRRKWGGCPDGCNHAEHVRPRRPKVPVRQNTADLFKGESDEDVLKNFDATRRGSHALDNDGPNASDSDAVNVKNQQTDAISKRRPPNVTLPSPHDVVSSPDATPSYISLTRMTTEETTPMVVPNPENNKPMLMSNRTYALLRMGGRDGGGSTSGLGSSDDEESGGDTAIKTKYSTSPVQERHTPRRDHSLQGRHRRKSRSRVSASTNGSHRDLKHKDFPARLAEALGDHSDANIDEPKLQIKDKYREAKDDDITPTATTNSMGLPRRPSLLDADEPGAPPTAVRTFEEEEAHDKSVNGSVY